MGYSFTDLGAEGCRRSLNALFKMVFTFNHEGGSFNLFITNTADVWVIPSFWGVMCCMLSMVFMCHYEKWPTWVSHHFSSLDSSLGLAGGKHYHEIDITIFRLVLQNFALPGGFPYILICHYFFIFTFFWLDCYCSMWLFLSREQVKY